jgi:hypothetical protein
LMLSAVFAPFLGAIAMVFGWVGWAVVEGRLGRLAAEVVGEQEFIRRSVCERESSIVRRSERNPNPGLALGSECLWRHSVSDEVERGLVEHVKLEHLRTHLI